MYLLSYLDIHVYIAYTNKRKKKRRDRENETERCVSNMLYCIYLCLLVSWIFHLSLNIKKSQKGSMPWRLSRRNPIPNAPSCSSSSLLWYRGDRWEPLVNKKTADLLMKCGWFRWFNQVSLPLTVPHSCTGGKSPRNFAACSFGCENITNIMVWKWPIYFIIWGAIL